MLVLDALSKRRFGILIWPQFAVKQHKVIPIKSAWYWTKMDQFFLCAQSYLMATQSFSLLAPYCGRPCIWYWTHFALKTIKAAVNRFLWHSCVPGLSARHGVRQETVSPKRRRSATPFQEIRGRSARRPKSIHPLRERIDHVSIRT